jgi:hypothetical protein
MPVMDILPPCECLGDELKVLALEVPESAAMEVIGAAAADHGEIGCLGKLGAVGGRVNTEFRNAFDGWEQIAGRPAVPGKLGRDAVKRKGCGGRQLLNGFEMF